MDGSKRSIPEPLNVKVPNWQTCNLNSKTPKSNNLPDRKKNKGRLIKDAIKSSYSGLFLFYNCELHVLTRNKKKAPKSIICLISKELRGGSKKQNNAKETVNSSNKGGLSEELTVKIIKYNNEDINWKKNEENNS